MNCRAIIERSRSLPFFNLSTFTLSQLFQTNKSKVLETLENNNFSKNMIKHVNGFSKNNYTCSYYEEESLHQLSTKHLPDSLKVFHVNIESFASKGRELSSYLKCLKLDFDLLCITEIRSTSISLIDKEFPNFHIYIDNPSTAKGGVALLLRKDKFKEITEIDTNANFNLKDKLAGTNSLVENKWISCKIDNQNVIIGGIYRHPNRNLDSFNNALKKTLENINDNTLSIILGDLNINLLQEHEANVNCYLNNYFENNFIPCITLPTRITNHSTTLIDHIFVKMPKKLIQNKVSSGNIIVDIADHLPNFTFINIKTPTIKDRPNIGLFT